MGDIVRFGQSSRLYLFTGPAELLPEEGPSRDQRMQLKALEARIWLAQRTERQRLIKFLKSVTVPTGMSVDSSTVPVTCMKLNFRWVWLALVLRTTHFWCCTGGAKASHVPLF